MFHGERASGATDTKRSYSICCDRGQVELRNISVPDQILNLFNNNDRNFWNNIRRYNSAIALGSIHANVVPFQTPGPSSYRVNGMIYHRISSLETEADENARYIQVYFLGDDQPSIDYFSDLNQTLLTSLRTLQKQNNVLLQNIMNAYEYMTRNNNDNIQNFVMTIRRPEGELDRRTHNVPSIVEIAAFIPGLHYVNDYLSMHVFQRGGGLRFIDHVHRDYDSFAYPLFFIHGQPGFEQHMYELIRKNDIEKDNNDNCDDEDDKAHESHKRSNRNVNDTNRRRFAHDADESLINKKYNSKTRVKISDIPQESECSCKTKT